MDFSVQAARYDELFGVGRNFDMIGRDLVVGGRRARLWAVSGYAKDALLERTVASLMALPRLPAKTTARDFVACCVSAPDAAAETDEETIVTAVFAGKTLIIVEGLEGGILIDAKGYPTRSVAEPDTSKVLRGSHDGFLENVMENAALLRRRVRDPALTLERFQVSDRSRTDVIMVYMKDTAEQEDLNKVRQKLRNIDVKSIAVSQESVAECIVPKQWWNPFPKVRYTERPDVATASIMEGDILILVDNSPAALLLPTTVFSFAEEINDYFFPPLIGSYLQTLRLVVLFLTLFITPLWYLLVKNPETLPENLKFLLVEGDCYVPLIVQLLLVEFIIDILKLASLNTPDALSNSFSMLGALILGDFAVQARWLVPEVLVYMAFVAVVNYAQHSYEMGYATKLCRMFLLILIWLGDWIGFALGVVGILALIASTKTVVGKGYLYPLIPFNGKVLWRILHRRPISRDNT